MAVPAAAVPAAAVPAAAARAAAVPARLVLLVCALAAAVCLGFGATAASPADAWAAGDYTASIVATDAPESINAGDEFTVSEVLTANGESQFTMYALATVVSFDADKLELVSAEAGGTGTATIQSGKVVYNALASAFAGDVCNSPLTLCTIRFRALSSGSASVSFDRAKVSTYSGMKSYSVTTVGAVVTVADGGSVEDSEEEAVPVEPIAPADPVVPDSSDAPDASDVGKDAPGAFADNVRANPRDAYGETLTAADVTRLEQAGFTDDELVSLGYAQDELDRARAGEEVVPELSQNDNVEGVEASSSTASGAKESVSLGADGSSSAGESAGFPVVAVVIVIIVVVAAAIAAVVLIRRRNGAARAE